MADPTAESAEAPRSADPVPAGRARAGAWAAWDRVARRPALTAFAAIFLACLVVGLIQGSKLFYGDSGGYWHLAETFGGHGSFDFLHFEYTGLRGYSWPLTLYGVQKIGDLTGLQPWVQVVLANSALFALLTGVLAPALARAAWPRRAWGPLPRLGLGAIFLIFWSGYLNFPLSDFPALVAAVLAVVAISHARSPLWLGLAGLAAAYAVNARPAYLLLIPLLIAVLAWTWWRDDAGRPPTASRGALCVAAFVLGLAVVTVPQSIISSHSGRGAAPLPGGSGLAGLQYTEGLRLQRYGTHVGEHPFMDYFDPHTASIRAELPLETVSGTSKYLEIALDHPITIAGVFLRHLVNGLDQRYTTPYVEEVEPSGRDLLRLAGFLIVFLALFRVLWPRGRRSFGGDARWRYPLALALCCLTSLPSAIEARFMLPIYLLSAMFVLTPGWPSPLESEASGVRRLRTVAVGGIALAAYLLLVGSIVDGATNNLRIL